MLQNVACKFCPECAKRNVFSRMKLFQVSFDGAILLCSKEDCIGDFTRLEFVDRKLEDIVRKSRAKRKRNGRSSKNNSLKASEVPTNPSVSVQDPRSNSSQIQCGSSNCKPEVKVSETSCDINQEDKFSLSVLNDQDFWNNFDTMCEDVTAGLPTSSTMLGNASDDFLRDFSSTYADLTKDLTDVVCDNSEMQLTSAAGLSDFPVLTKDLTGLVGDNSDTQQVSAAGHSDFTDLTGFVGNNSETQLASAACPLDFIDLASLVGDNNETQLVSEADPLDFTALTGSVGDNSDTLLVSAAGPSEQNGGCSEKPVVSDTTQLVCDTVMPVTLKTPVLPDTTQRLCDTVMPVSFERPVVPGMTRLCDTVTPVTLETTPVQCNAKMPDPVVQSTVPSSQPIRLQTIKIVKLQNAIQSKIAYNSKPVALQTTPMQSDKIMPNPVRIVKNTVPLSQNVQPTCFQTIKIVKLQDAIQTKIANISNVSRDLNKDSGFLYQLLVRKSDINENKTSESATRVNPPIAIRTYTKNPVNNNNNNNTVFVRTISPLNSDNSNASDGDTSIVSLGQMRVLSAIKSSPMFKPRTQSSFDSSKTELVKSSKTHPPHKRPRSLNGATKPTKIKFSSKRPHSLKGTINTEKQMKTREMLSNLLQGSDLFGGTR